MGKITKMRVIDSDKSPARTLYNDLDFDKLNEIHKKARSYEEKKEESKYNFKTIQEN